MHSCGRCSTTPLAGSARWLRGASLATRDTGSSARIEASGARHSSARLYIEAALTGTCPAMVADRDRRVDARGPFLKVSQIYCYQRLGRSSVSGLVIRSAFRAPGLFVLRRGLPPLSPHPFSPPAV